MKIRRKILAILLPILLLAVFTCSVHARGGVFEIQPYQEAVQSLPSLNTAESAAGNVSAGGYIDFYVLSPNGTVLLFYNHTDFAEFKFYPNIEGICTMHMANNYESKSVNVTLQYGINFVVVLQAGLGLSPSITVTTEQPFDWSAFVNLLKSLGYIVGSILYPLYKTIKAFKKWLRNAIWKLWWWKKYRKNKTPSTILTPTVESP